MRKIIVKIVRQTQTTAVKIICEAVKQSVIGRLSYLIICRKLLPAALFERNGKFIHVVEKWAGRGIALVLVRRAWGLRKILFRQMTIAASVS